MNIFGEDNISDGQIYNDFTGATNLIDGSNGLVPKPLAGEQDFYLRGDGTWKSTIVTVSNVASGSQTAPSYSFSSDTNTGMYRSNFDELAFTTAGVQKLKIDSTGLITATGRMLVGGGTAAAPSYSFATNTNAGLDVYTTGVSLSYGGTAYLFVEASKTKVANVLTVPDGTAALPSITFDSDQNTGIYKSLPDEISISTGGTRRFYITPTGSTVTSGGLLTSVGSASKPSLGFTGTFHGLYIDSQAATASICFATNQNNRCKIRTSDFVPATDNLYGLGSALNRWSVVYAGTGTINTSDATQKIITGDVPSLNFISKLKPVMYKFVDIPDVVENGVVKVPGVKHTRNHYGFLAQDIETLINNGDITDSGLFIKTGVSEDGNDINLKDITDETKIKQFNYGLRYDELIAPLVKAVQELNNKIKILESKI